jgi:DNA-directed RNA polymerase specialized sigma24 family protein
VPRLEYRAIISALRILPGRQRAIVLRYHADLSEAQIAAAVGISRAAVKSHSGRQRLRCAPSWTIVINEAALLAPAIAAAERGR